MSYGLQDLLNLTSVEKAERLILKVGKPPSILLLGEEEAIEGPDFTQQNGAEFISELANPEQIRELDSCGDVQFIYSTADERKFAVVAKIEHDVITLVIRNLAVPTA